MKSHRIQIIKASPLESYQSLEGLLTDVRACRAGDAHLRLSPRPIVQAGATARILIVGQAPGASVHASGVPWDDKSGQRLRDWMGVDAKTFYDAAQIAILPMGYCYPGRAASGDLPPRREALSCGSIACSQSCRTTRSRCSSANMRKPISCAARVT